MRALACAAVLLWASSVPVLAAGTEPAQRLTLANGLRAVVQHVDAQGRVIVLASVALTPALDPPGKEGTGALAAAVIGPRLRATGPASDVAPMLARLAADLGDAHVTAATFARIVASERRALALRRVDVTERAQRAFDRAIYRFDDPVLRAETPATLVAITSADVSAYLQRNVIPQHTTLVVAGDIDPATVRTAIATAFGAWPRAAHPVSLTLPPPATPMRSITFIASRDALVHLRIGRSSVGRSDPAFYALTLVNAVLAARLQRRFSGMASSALLTTRERGVLIVDASVPPTAANAARVAIKADIAQLRSSAIPGPEWNAARRALLTTAAVTDPALPAAVARLQNMLTNDLPLDYFARLPQFYAASPRDGLRAARTFLSGDRFAEVIVGAP